MKKSIYKILSSILSVVLLASGCNSELAIMDQTNPDAIVSSTFETTKTLDNSSSVDVFRTQVTQAFVEPISAALSNSSTPSSVDLSKLPALQINSTA